MHAPSFVSMLSYIWLFANSLSYLCTCYPNHENYNSNYVFFSKIKLERRGHLIISITLETTLQQCISHRILWFSDLCSSFELFSMHGYFNHEKMQLRIPLFYDISDSNEEDFSVQIRQIICD